MYVWMYVIMHVCMYVCMYVCMHVCKLTGQGGRRVSFSTSSMIQVASCTGWPMGCRAWEWKGQWIGCVISMEFNIISGNLQYVHGFSLILRHVAWSPFIYPSDQQSQYACICVGHRQSPLGLVLGVLGEVWMDAMLCLRFSGLGFSV